MNKTVACRCLIAFLGLIVMPLVSGAELSQASPSKSGDDFSLKSNAEFNAIGIFTHQGDERYSAVPIRLACGTGSQP